MLSLNVFCKTIHSSNAIFMYVVCMYFADVEVNMKSKLTLFTCSCSYCERFIFACYCLSNLWSKCNNLLHLWNDFSFCLTLSWSAGEKAKHVSNTVCCLLQSLYETSVADREKAGRCIFSCFLPKTLFPIPIPKLPWLCACRLELFRLKKEEYLWGCGSVWGISLLNASTIWS